MKVTLFLLAVICASVLASFPVNNDHGYHGASLSRGVGLGVAGSVLGHGYNYGYQPYGYSNHGYNGYNGGYNGYNGHSRYSGNNANNGYNGYNGYHGNNGHNGYSGYNGPRVVVSSGHGPYGYGYNNNVYNSYYPHH